MLKCIMIGLLLTFFLPSGAQPLKATPTLLLPGLISTNLNERDMTISADGSEMYYTLLSNQNVFSTILYRKKLSSGSWSPPEVAPFSGRYRDLEPSLSPDGSKLFFSSDRPAPGKEGNDYDIWVVERLNGKWSDPKNLGAPVNTEANEFYPSVTLNGNLYFTASYDKGIGKEDIFLSQWANGSFSESIALDSAVNSATWEFNAYVSPDESFILFTSYGRKDDMGGGDLYISFKGPSDTWQPARNLKDVNSSKLDYCPFVSADKKTLFLTSQRHNIPGVRDHQVSYNELVRIYTMSGNGSDDIYVADFQSVLNGLK